MHKNLDDIDQFSDFDGATFYAEKLIQNIHTNKIAKMSLHSTSLNLSKIDPSIVHEVGFVVLSCVCQD